jgi:hypothetical protein
MSSIMRSELERLARVAVGHGRDDPALDVFLVFVGALDPVPGAETLQPAARRIGKLRLAEALDRPGETRLGACRLLAAACAVLPRAEPALRLEDDQAAAAARNEAASSADTGVAGRPVGVLPRIVPVKRPVEVERGLPELFEELLHAVRAVFSLFA